MMRRDIDVKVNTSSQRHHEWLQHQLTSIAIPRLHRRLRLNSPANTSRSNAKHRFNAGAAAKSFIDNQVSAAREALAAVDRQRLDFMSSHVGNLPSEATALFNQLSGLREEQKALIAEVGRLQDRRAAAANQLILIKQQNAQIIEDAAENLTDPKTTMAWSQLVTRKASLEGELTRLRQELKKSILT